MPATLQKPSLRRVPASDHAGIIQVLKEDGGCIITNFAPPEEVQQVNAETKPWIDADKPWKGALFPPETRRCTRLVGRSKTVREKWLLHPTIEALTKEFLSKTTKNWYEDTQHTYTTTPILEISITMEIRPGAKGQRLHRDDKNHHVDHRDQTRSGYTKDADVSMGFLIPGVKTTVENGATLAIPGSHLWGDERAPSRDDVVYAEMDVGECFAFLGSVYHAGGTNSTIDQNRPMHSLFYCRSTLRTEENQYLVYTPEEVMSWPPAVQEKIGYGVSHPNLGHVDFIKPLEYFNESYDKEAIRDLDDVDAAITAAAAAKSA